MVKYIQCLLDKLKPKLQHLTDLQKQKRAVEFHEGFHARGRFFSDEELFRVRAQFNTQNGRMLAKHHEDTPEDLKTVAR